jgi:microsomal dipeptidase-like Zn-dependent dipeptidase
LLASGLHEDEVARVIGGNVARVLEDARAAANEL